MPIITVTYQELNCIADMANLSWFESNRILIIILPWIIF